MASTDFYRQHVTWMVAENPSSKPEPNKASLLDGARIAAEIKEEVHEDVRRLLQGHGFAPRLAAIRVGNDPASEVYVRNKIRACEEVEIHSQLHALTETTTANQLLALISSLNSREDIDGILVQLPLPRHIEEATIIETVDPAKDVDGFHPVNVGRLAMGRPVFVPCTPAGIIELLERSNIPIKGTNACVVGRSQIVGRPMAQLLLQRDATVTICHSRTRNLADVTRQADILVVAIGRPGLIEADHIKQGATVIDVGMNKISDPDTVRALFGAETESRLQIVAKRGYTLVGDVNPVAADRVASLRTPVPGGVGLLTVAMLMYNTVKAAKLRRRI